MLEKKCILLLYGEGRYDTSMKAIKDYIETNHRDAYVVAISDKELYSFNKFKIGFFIYKLSSRSCGFINSFNVKVRSLTCKLRLKNGKKKKIKSSKPATGVIGEFFYNITEKYRRIHNILIRYTPDVVVCSTPKLLHDTITAKHKGSMKNLSVAALITDYNLDSRFVDYRTNYYFVQNDDIQERLVGYGVEKRRIKVSGTPICRNVMKNHEREIVLRELGIENDNMNVVLVSGRYGGKVIKSAVMSLIEMQYDMNIILITGENDGLIKYTDMLAKTKSRERDVFIVEQVEDLSKLYAVADIMIAKPTATITFEAIYHNVKLITCRGAEGIEDRNAHYLATHQLSLLGDNNDDLVQSMSKYITDEEFCRDLAYRQNEYLLPNCDKVVGEILLLVAEKNYNKKKQLLIDADDATKKLLQSAEVDDVAKVEIASDSIEEDTEE